MAGGGCFEALGRRFEFCRPDHFKTKSYWQVTQAALEKYDPRIVVNSGQLRSFSDKLSIVVGDCRQSIFMDIFLSNKVNNSTNKSTTTSSKTIKVNYG